MIPGAASANDLVFWDAACVQSATWHEARDGMFRMFTHYRVQCLLLPDTMCVPKSPLVRTESKSITPASSKSIEATTRSQRSSMSGAGGVHSIWERLETMAYLALSTFCQRQVNSLALAREAGFDLTARLMDLPKTLLSLHTDGESDLRRFAQLLETVVRALQPVTTDYSGFRILCSEGRIIWLRATYVERLAERGGPCPRYQDLDPDGVIRGTVPTGRLISVSHSWDSFMHIDPSGAKLKRLWRVLRDIGATGPEDGVFIE